MYKKPRSLYKYDQRETQKTHYQNGTSTPFSKRIYQNGSYHYQNSTRPTVSVSWSTPASPKFGTQAVTFGNGCLAPLRSHVYRAVSFPYGFWFFRISLAGARGRAVFSSRRKKIEEIVQSSDKEFFFSTSPDSESLELLDSLASADARSRVLLPSGGSGVVPM